MCVITVNWPMALTAFVWYKLKRLHSLQLQCESFISCLQPANERQHYLSESQRNYFFVCICSNVRQSVAAIFVSFSRSSAIPWNGVPIRI